jgi:hypothetical protein
MPKIRIFPHIMRYVFIIFIIADIFGGDILAQNKPQAAVKTSSWDFGYLPQKSEVSHQFYIYNTGSAPLTVSKIKADCSCTGVSRVDQPIAPGDSAAIALTFKSGRYHGLVRKSAEVTTDDPDAPVQHLRIISHVIKEREATGNVTSSPQKLTWKIENGNIIPAIDTLRMTNNGPESATVSILQEPGEVVSQADVPRYIGPGKTADLVLHATKKTPPGKSEWYSTTLAIAGLDTTILTIPIKIEK